MKIYSEQKKTGTKAGQDAYPWEQRKFAELYIKNTEKNTDGSIGYDKTISVATMKYKDEGNGAATDSLTSYKVLRPGDIAFEGHTNKEFQYGRFVVNDIGVGLMSPRFSTLRPKSQMPISFWKYYIHSESVMRKVLVNATKSGTMMNELVIPELEKQIICVPSIEEQTVIGNMLSDLDDLITLHQCKHYRLRTGDLSSKLDPFLPHNTATWEQRKLHELVSEIKRTDANSDAPIMMITANDGFINQSERYSTENAGQSLKKYILLKKGELAYNHGASKLRPYGSCFALKTEEEARIPFVYHCFSTCNCNPDFLSIVLNGKSTERQLRRIVSSGARMDGLLNISYDDYTSIPIMIPILDEFPDLFRFKSKILIGIQKLCFRTQCILPVFIFQCMSDNNFKNRCITYSVSCQSKIRHVIQ